MYLKISSRDVTEGNPCSVLVPLIEANLDLFPSKHVEAPTKCHLQQEVDCFHVSYQSLPLESVKSKDLTIIWDLTV